MRTIHKYELDITDVQTIELPFYAEMLTIQEQRDKLVMWCIVDTEDDTEPRTFHVVDTGNPMPEPEDEGWPKGLAYCGTVQTKGGRLVWHVFTEIDFW
jgi:hypothetical protein